MGELLKQFMRQFESFQNEMLEFKDDVTQRLDRIERKLEASFEQVAVHSRI